MIHKGYVKLPDTHTLRQHLEQGLDTVQIAERYGCTRDRVRERIRRDGLVHLIPKTGNKFTPRKTTAPPALGVVVLPDKIVFTTEVTAGEYGGMARRSISLPRPSMHVNALREAGRC